MTNVDFIPNDPAHSDAEQTVYNVYVEGKFIGYISKSVCFDSWTYYVDGMPASDGYQDRCDIFSLIKETPTFGRA